MATFENEDSMRKVNGEGPDKLLGERVTLFCANYIYIGTLTSVNESRVLLSDAAVVYESGPFGENKWKRPLIK